MRCHTSGYVTNMREMKIMNQGTNHIEKSCDHKLPLKQLRIPAMMVQHVQRVCRHGNPQSVM